MFFFYIWFFLKVWQIQVRIEKGPWVNLWHNLATPDKREAKPLENVWTFRYFHIFQLNNEILLACCICVSRCFVFYVGLLVVLFIFVCCSVKCVVVTVASFAYWSIGDLLIWLPTLALLTHCLYNAIIVMNPNRTVLQF